MAKISAYGDAAVIKLRQPNGALVVLTERGRLLAQARKGSGYTLVDAHWVRPGWAIWDRLSVTQYLIDNRYPGSEVI